MEAIKNEFMVDFKNVSWWEWLIVLFVSILIFFPKLLMEKSLSGIIKYENVQNEKAMYERRDPSKKSFFRKLVQTVVAVTPFGGIINGLWNEFFPKK